MNSQIAKLFGLIVVLFVLLIVWTSRWTVFQADALNTNPLNAATLIEQLRVKRGPIVADDGTVLAKSIRGPQRTWRRQYPQGSLFSQVVGYAEPSAGDTAGLEQSLGDYVRGAPSGLGSVFGSLSAQQQGDEVQTTLDPPAQRLARQELAGRAGSVVALDPRTGAVLVMYSNPSYDDNHPHAKCLPPGCSLLNGATQDQNPPGSTFKVVTATAAIDSGRFTPNSVINGNSPKTISGVPLENDNNQSWGDINLTVALTNSVNTVFAQLAQDVGRGTMTDYMRRFGFYAKPPLDYPSAQVNISRPFSPLGRPFRPASPDEDIGRIGIGQGGLLVTPLQMALVAAAVANGGTLMTPHFLAKVVNSDGQVVQSYSPSVYNQVMSSHTAAEINQMMRKVVDEGTGTPAQLGSGIPFAGKTGTASVGANGSGQTEPWFIGFAPANSPKVAVAVTIDRTQGQFGGQVAAPIARDVVAKLMAEGK